MNGQVHRNRRLVAQNSLLHVFFGANHQLLPQIGQTRSRLFQSLSADVRVVGRHLFRIVPYHLHHDILFSFRALSDDFQVSEESRDIAWCAPGDFDHYAVPENVRRAYLRMRKLAS